MEIYYKYYNSKSKYNYLKKYNMNGGSEKNKLITKTIKTEKCHFDYAYYEYKYNLINPSLEIERIKFLENHNVNPDTIIDNISANKNTLDVMIPDELFYEFNPSIENTDVKLLQNDDNIILKFGEFEQIINNQIYHKMHKDLRKTDLTEIEKNNLIFCIFIRYDFTKMLTNIQLAVPRHIYKYYMEKKGALVELFGSAMNHTMPYFCSLFYDLEKYFGSVGNHFNINIYYGTYLLNPPFVEAVMDKSIERIMDMMDNNKFTVYIFIPVWDIDGRNYINKVCKLKVKITLDWELIKKLDNFKFTKKKKIYCKESFYYFDYVNFRKINATPTYKYKLSSVDN